jgi:hypothetical protein
MAKFFLFIYIIALVIMSILARPEMGEANPSAVVYAPSGSDPSASGDDYYYYDYYGCEYYYYYDDASSGPSDASPSMVY